MFDLFSSFAQNRDGNGGAEQLLREGRLIS